LYVIFRPQNEKREDHKLGATVVCTGSTRRVKVENGKN